MKKILVCGAGGFIGNHLVNRLKEEGFWVRGVDLKYPVYNETNADEFIKGDLRDKSTCEKSVEGGIDNVYQLAADMGGAGFIFTGENYITPCFFNCNWNILNFSSIDRYILLSLTITIYFRKIRI